MAKHGKNGAVRAPWETDRGVDAVVDHWLASNIVKPCLTADETVPGRDAKMARLPDGPEGLPTPLAFALRGRGNARLEQLASRRNRPAQRIACRSRGFACADRAAHRSTAAHLLWAWYGAVRRGELPRPS